MLSGQSAKELHFNVIFLGRDNYLICEESVQAFLTVEWGPVVDHLGVNFDLVDPLHVVAQLLQVLHTKANQNSLNQVHIKGHRPKEYSVCKT